MSEGIHEHWMQKAIDQAMLAGEKGEVPVGAVLVEGDNILGQGFNQSVSSKDPTAHAEIVAIRQAAKAKDNYRLPGTTLYVTIEPCTMCIGAIVHARISTLVFGALEPRAGAVLSQQQLLSEQNYNHKVEVTHGVMAQPCGAMLKDFFRSKRLAS